MRTVAAWLGVAALVLLSAPPARAGTPTALKPYVVLILDTSGSMDAATGSGPPSCGGTDTKLNHARCAINKIANSYGDMVFALARFRETPSGTYPSCGTTGIDCGSGTGAPTASSNLFELLSPLVDGNNAQAALYTDFVQNTCALDPTQQPEISGTGSWTPLAGSLKGAKLYWSGVATSPDPWPAPAPYGPGGGTAPTTIWPSTAAGFAPIANDPTKNSFLASGEQCRPYITVMLTDGDETCATFATTTAATAALLTTSVGGKTYKIRTRPIGFGKSPGDAQIEGIAHAGGAADLPGVNEGFYATDEAGLELALTKIIGESLRTESCNGLDDNCNTLVDEDFPNKGTACDNGQQGVCRGTGVYACRADGTGTQCNITSPGQAPSAETCNGKDDDCDGLVDEGNVCPVGCGTVEICNNLDDDCDLKIDEGITRPCGSNVGVCHAGTETCVAGVFQGCTATGGSTEVCNGLDDNCDGVVDGFSRGCSNLPGGNPGLGVCHPGTQSCPPSGGGVFGACLGEVGPTPEACNNLDDDCDGTVDEGTGGGDCSSSCGLGQIVCTGGVLMCNSTTAGDDATCNNIDDDCDGRVDENAPPGGPCDGGGTICMGQSSCVGGQYVCQGQTIGTESCNCGDDDCDGRVDETPNCPSGSTCSNCQCAFPCAAGEFPCPLGKECKAGFCVADPCFNVTCPPVAGNAQVCQEGACVDACAVAGCAAPLVCVPSTGQCKPDDCTTFPDRCNAMQNCVNGQCVTNLCQGVTCPAGQYCVGGSCVGSCVGVTCPDGQRCRLGACEADPCGHPCPFGQSCNTTTGTCQPNPCQGRTCPQGQWCNPDDGQCQDDPCVGTACPVAGQVCVGGTCYDPSQFQPDAGPEIRVSAGGGGGCATTGDGAGALALLPVGLALARRRRARRAVAAGGRS